MDAMNMVHIWAMEIVGLRHWLLDSSLNFFHSDHIVGFPRHYFIRCSSSSFRLSPSLLEVPGYCSTHPVFQHEEYIIVFALYALSKLGLRHVFTVPSLIHTILKLGAFQWFRSYDESYWVGAVLLRIPWCWSLAREYKPWWIISTIHCAPTESVRIFKNIRAKQRWAVFYTFYSWSWFSFRPWILKTEEVAEPQKCLTAECKRIGIADCLNHCVTYLYYLLIDGTCNAS